MTKLQIASVWATALLFFLVFAPLWVFGWAWWGVLFTGVAAVFFVGSTWLLIYLCFLIATGENE